MGFFDELKLKKDGNGNIKITYSKKPFIVINTERVYDIIDDYATKAFINRITKLKTETPANDEQFLEAEKLARIYNREKKVFYGRPRIKTIDTKSRDFNFFIDAIYLISNLETDNDTFLKAQIKGLEFVNTFPSPKQLTGEGAEKRFLDYISFIGKATKTKISHQDYEIGSLKYRELNNAFKDGYELGIEEVQYLIEYHSRNYNQVPNSLSDYLKELTENAN